MPQYLVALPIFPAAKGFNHQTILVSAKDENDARALVRHLKPHSNIGDIKVTESFREQAVQLAESVNQFNLSAEDSVKRLPWKKH